MLKAISYVYKYCHYIEKDNSISENYKERCKYYIEKLNEKVEVLGIEYNEKNEGKVKGEFKIEGINRELKSICDLSEDRIGSIKFEIFNEIKDKLPERKYINGDILKGLKSVDESFKADFEKLKDIIEDYEMCKKAMDGKNQMSNYVGGKEARFTDFIKFCEEEFLPSSKNLFRNSGIEYKVKEGKEIKLIIPSIHTNYNILINELNKNMSEFNRESIQKIKGKLPEGKYINPENLEIFESYFDTFDKLEKSIEIYEACFDHSPGHANTCEEVEKKVNKMFGLLGLEYKKKEGTLTKKIEHVKNAISGFFHKGEASGVKKGPNNEKYIELQKPLLGHDSDDGKV